MRNRGVIGAAFAAALLCVVAGSASASRNMRVGITDEAALLWGPTATTVKTYEELHVQVARMDLYWGGRNGVANAEPMHPRNPADPAYDWSIYDHIVRRLHNAGIQVLFSIYGTPAWANGGRAPNVGPLHPADLKDFAYAAARRYSGHFVSRGIRLPAVRDWLAWNEPNNPIFLRPQFKRNGPWWVMASAKEYTKICNAIFRGVHDTRIKNEKVACGGTAPRGNNNPHSSRPSISPVAFLRAVKRDGLRTFNAWDTHPYYAYPSERPSQAAPAGGSIELGNINKLIHIVTRLYGKKPIWITEYAYETNPPATIFGVPWRTQARYLTEAFKIARRNNRIKLMMWFMLKDDPSSLGWQSGLETATGQIKPAFYAFRRIALAQEKRAFAVRRRPSSSGTAGR
jgi:hypothetical protein